MSDKKHVLLVEDNLVAMKVAQMMLSMAGCEVDLAKDGPEAVTMATKNHYDGICMDIGLPTLSGVEACKAIRQYEIEHHVAPTPIIAVTGNNSPEEAREYLQAGMQSVIEKPLTKEKTLRFLSYCH